MIWEGEPLPETRRRLEDLSVRSVVFRPCGNVPPLDDYIEEMRSNTGGLATGFAD